MFTAKTGQDEFGISIYILFIYLFIYYYYFFAKLTIFAKCSITVIFKELFNSKKGVKILGLE